MRVRLLDASNPCLVLAAVKVSQGKVLEHGLERYYPECDGEKLRGWLRSAALYDWSVLEHLVLHFYVEDVTRVLSHQLVRHRIASVTQESQRYSEHRLVEAAKCIARHCGPGYDASSLDGLARCLHDVLHCSVKVDVDEVLRCLSHCFNIVAAREAGDDVWGMLDRHYRYLECRVRGHKPEVCRYLLPQYTLTSLLLTINLRSFLNMYCLRATPVAQPEFRVLATLMMEETSKKLPWLPEIARLYCGRCPAYPYWEPVER